MTLRFTGNVWRKNDKIAQRLLLWEPAEGKRKSGRPKYTYVDQLRGGTGLKKAHLIESCKTERNGDIMYNMFKQVA